MATALAALVGGGCAPGDPGGRISITSRTAQPVRLDAVFDHGGYIVEPAAVRLGLALIQAEPPTSAAAFLGPPPHAQQLKAPRPEWAARRKYRSGALGTVHWLGRWGYEHRRCEGDADMHVHASTELVFSAAAPTPASAP